MLVVMGGPMSANDEVDFPWLIFEKQFIRDVIDAGKPVLGICLGTQLIASAMVYRNPVKEIGWFPIQAVPSADDSHFSVPPLMEVLHWHGETFDLPDGAVQLAKSQGCQNQAFQIGRSVIGLQFHLETTPASACDLVSHCRAELVPAKYIQTEEKIMLAKPECYRAINLMMGKVLSYLHGNRT